MALQVSGTTVVNNSRQLQNIASLDNTTTNTIAAAAGGVDYSSPTYASASSGTNNVLFTAGSGGAFGFWWLYFNHNAGSGNMNVTGSGSYIGRTGTGTYSNIGSAQTTQALGALQIGSGIWYLRSGGTIRFTVNSGNRGTGSIMGYQL
jgi:hypothetical protein